MIGAEAGMNDAGKAATAGIECGITAKYVMKNAAMGTRLGYTWSTTDNAKPIAQVLMDASSGVGNFRPGFVPGSCPSFHFDQNPEDHSLGSIVMSKLSLSAILDDFSDFDVLGSLDVYDSRFSSINMEQNWSLGVVYKRVKNLDIGIVANAKAEVGLGIGINLPMVSIQIGAFNQLKLGSQSMSSDIFDTKKIQYCVGVEFPSLPESKRALIAVDER